MTVWIIKLYPTIKSSSSISSKSYLTKQIKIFGVAISCVGGFSEVLIFWALYSTTSCVGDFSHLHSRVSKFYNRRYELALCWHCWEQVWKSHCQTHSTWRVSWGILYQPTRPNLTPWSKNMLVKLGWLIFTLAKLTRKTIDITNQEQAKGHVEN